MSIQAMEWVLRESRAKLSIGARLVLLVIAWHADRRGTAWLLQRVMAREARLTVRQVRNCVRALERSGELEVLPRVGPQGRLGYLLARFPAVEKPVENGGRARAPG